MRPHRQRLQSSCSRFRAPPNSQMVAPKARKGPKGTRAPVLSRARKIPARAAAQPMIERRAECEENRFPSEERADGGDQLDVTEAHGFARDDDCAQRSGDLFQISQRRFLVGKDHPVVTEPKDRRRSGDVGARAFEHEFVGLPGEDILPGQCLIADREGRQRLRLAAGQTVPLFQSGGACARTQVCRIRR